MICKGTLCTVNKRINFHAGIAKSGNIVMRLTFFTVLRQIVEQQPTGYCKCLHRINRFCNLPCNLITTNNIPFLHLAV
jgi:hypothetical protein